MPAPTALQRAPETLAEEVAVDQDMQLEQHPTDTELVTETQPQPPQSIQPDQSTQQEDDTAMQIDPEGRPHFTPSTDPILSSPTQTTPTLATKIHSRKVPIPPHRLTPLKSAWPKIYPPLVEHLKLQVRMNIKSKAVEMRTSRYTTSTDSLQKGEDFIRAFTLGFDVDDAIALLRLDDLYIETFEIKDVKTLNGEHLGRAIGRIAGKDGKTKFAIENTKHQDCEGGGREFDSGCPAGEGIWESADCGGEDEGEVLGLIAPRCLDTTFLKGGK
ncbi:pre-rRNA-processing protein pno1 [Exophiala xenobiotica]|uniref:Pre-rRNA-processing protein PNO1 n=1 Tax=Lithohypha guttulata TaxID=1690604 RepID=A0ABR0K2I8_9EURO|nr:pre-rRNA-processing protein pno1 [Lithohypha guttulata]KAK5312687.1 pre-rRNA-processing protein pno1 [Exophiala xenobiotica]